MELVWRGHRGACGGVQSGHRGVYAEGVKEWRGQRDIEGH